MTLTSAWHETVQDVQSLEPGWLYHTPEWSGVLSDGFGVRSGCVVTHLDGQAVALLPVFWRSKFGVKLGGSPLSGLFTEFVGPRYAPDLPDAQRHAALRQQVDTLRGRGFRYVELGVQGDRGVARSAGGALEEAGFTYEQKNTLVVDLSQGLDAVWDGFQGRARNMVRKAEKQGVTCGPESFRGAVVDDFVDMLRATFEHQGLALPHPPAAFEALSRHLKPTGLIFIGARFEERLVSAGIFLHHADRMMFLSGSSTAEGYKLAAASSVQWEAIQEGHRRGARSYDLGGVGIDSIDRFKTSFGGAEANHHRWVYTSPLLRRGVGIAKWLAAKGLLKIHKPG